MSRLYFIFAILICSVMGAQNAAVDSLKAVLKTATNDTVKCNLLYYMVESETDDKLWPVYNDELFHLAEKNLKTAREPRLVKFYMTKLGIANINKGYYSEQFEMNMQSALEYYKRATEFLKQGNDLSALATSYNNQGSIYEKTGNIRSAIENYEISLKYKEQIGNTKGVALTLNNIGMVFQRQGDYKSAVKYLLRSMNLYKEIKDENMISYLCNNLGFTYQKMNNNPLAETYFKIAITYWEKTNNRKALSYIYNNLGSVYQDMNRLKEAKEMTAKSYAIAESLGDKHVLAYSNLNFARIAMIEKDIATAEVKAKKALDLSKELAYPENIRDACSLLSVVYGKKKNYTKALEMYEEHIKMRDSIINRENEKAAISIELKYEFEKKAAADSVRVVQEKRLAATQLEKEKTQRSALYMGLGSLGVFALFMVNRYRVIRKQKEIINEQKKLVEQQKLIVDEKQKEIMDSIHYARRIQLSHLPSDKYLAAIFSKIKK